MSVAFVLGNGKSRLAVDPQQDLVGKGIIYACNAIYREFMPNVLISTTGPYQRRYSWKAYPNVSNTGHADHYRKASHTK